MNSWRRASTLLRGEYGPILIGLFFAVILGLVVGGDYGESWDEYGDYKYGEESLQAYVRPDQFAPYSDHGYYGPFYLMLGTVTSDIFPHLRPGWLTSDGRHFSSYLTFVACSFFIYLLMRRFTPRLPALVATLLFFTQPLLFGHSFINQKDIPFMAFFTATIAICLVATDVWGRHAARSPEEHPHAAEAVGRRRSLGADWEAGSWMLRVGLILAVLVAVLIAIDLIAGILTFPWILRTVKGAYDGEAPPIITALFRLVATDAYKTPLELYLDKALSAYVWLRILVIGLAFLPAAALARRIFASSLDTWGRTWLRQQSVVLSAGVVLGLCTSVRVAGPLAGALVSAAFLVRHGRRSVAPLVTYWATATLVTLATWPFLWADPVGRVWESIRLMSEFSSHLVLYNGQSISSLSLPWHFLPTLTMIQLTLPAILLAFVGATFAAKDYIRRPETRLESSIVGLWLGVPAIAVMFFHRPLYNNFRQALFILPPVFILGGLGLGRALAILRGRALRVGLIGLVLAPGVLGFLQLHPYEYVYYSSVIGGTDGAVGRFELDYWCTSYRRAAEFVNQVAEEHSSVVVTGPDAAFITFARPDLFVRNAAITRGSPDYAVACGPPSAGSTFFPAMLTVFEVKRGAATLAVVKSAK